MKENEEENDDDNVEVVKEKEEEDAVVLEARLILSTLGRPVGWFLRLSKASYVEAILRRMKKDDDIDIEKPYVCVCGGRVLKIQSYTPPPPTNTNTNNMNMSSGNHFKKIKITAFSKEYQ